jgi:hypothetical protein
MTSLNKALSLNPRNVIALLHIGIWHYTKGEYAAAKLNFQDASLIDK